MKRSMFAAVIAAVALLGSAGSAHADLVLDPVVSTETIGRGVLVAGGLFVLAVGAVAVFVLRHLARRRRAETGGLRTGEHDEEAR